jgi:glutathione synthase/RimK-type ligase-like ATP-grasp enzyme
MPHYDICLPWYWEYDVDFIQMVEHACGRHDVTLWQVTPDSVLEKITSLYTGKVSFGTLLDRGQGDQRFEPIHRWARDHHIQRINPPEISERAENKAAMHLVLIDNGIYAPYTLLLAPFVEQPLLPDLDLTPLGERIVIKPAYGGGGEGVVSSASDIQAVLRTRLEFPDQTYLVQSLITARDLEGRPAWFRVFYVGGQTWPCWWNPSTHVFAILSAEDEARYRLTSLREITTRIAALCGLVWFSTEIACTDDGQFVAVDYVNDSIDLRVQSRAADGVPDRIVHEMAEQLVVLAKVPA